jgi:hypothetical protein
MRLKCEGKEGTIDGLDLAAAIDSGVGNPRDAGEAICKGSSGESTRQLEIVS